MSVKIDRVLTCYNEADLIVIPMHAKTMQKPQHYNTSRNLPVSISYCLFSFKDIESDGKLAMGDIVISERIDTATVVWLIGRGDIRRKFDLLYYQGVKTNERIRFTSYL